MASNKYLDIVSHYESCLDKFGDTHRGVDWPNRRDALTRYGIMLDSVNSSENASVLDFGCGTAHMFEYMKASPNQYGHLRYHGSDISPKFIQKCEEKFPETPFYCFDLLKDDLSEIPLFDFVILNGVFTEKRNLSFDEMWDYFQQMILNIMKLTNRGIAFNVMSTHVDWQRDDLFHLPTDLLIDFMVKNLSRNFVIRNDYGLYEYTVYLYKD